MDILDQILATEMANEYTDSQRLAYEETTVITWDGNTDGKTMMPGDEEGYYRVQVSKKIPPVVITDKNAKEIVKRICVTYKIGETFQEIDRPVELFAVCYVPEENITCFSLDTGMGEQDYIFIVYEDLVFPEEGINVPKGIYFVFQGDENNKGYVSRLELETVHQIDPKFIPETPVFTPTTEIPYGGEPAMLTKEENDKLMEIARKHDVIRVAYAGKIITATRFYDSGIESDTSEAWYYLGMYLGATGAYPSVKTIMLVCEPSGEACMAMIVPLAYLISYDIPGLTATAEET